MDESSKTLRVRRVFSRRCRWKFFIHKEEDRLGHAGGCTLYPSPILCGNRVANGVFADPNLAHLVTVLTIS